MPGHNHYSNCWCGWCVKPGSGAWRSRPFAPVGRPGSSPHEARVILEGYGATRGYYACFVNPNATCPVCGASVYYYENSHGSRVFFDELGKPWPVHGCTSERPVAVGKAITPRPPSHIEDIHYCRAVISSDPAMDFERRYREPPSYVVRVVECLRRGLENYVRAEPLVGEAEVVFLRFTSQKVDPGVGDLLSMRGGEVSIFIDGATRPTFKAKMIQAVEFEKMRPEARGSDRPG